MEDKEMCRMLPYGACPKCAGRQFVVYECEESEYITGVDGEILEYDNLGYRCYGKCIRCGYEYDMIQYNGKFFMSSPLRDLIAKPYIFWPNIVNCNDNTLNPMEE